MFRLQGCFEDDTIYLQSFRTSSGVYQAVPVGAGAVFIFILRHHPPSHNQMYMETLPIEIV